MKYLIAFLLCLPSFAQLLPVDTAIIVTIGPLIDDTDFKTLETAIAYNAAGMSVDLIVSSGTTATKTDLTLTTGSTQDWTALGNGIYQLEITAAQNNTEGELQVVGVCTGVLPFYSSVYTVVPVAVFNSIISGTDNLQVDTIQIEGADATNSINAEADLALADYDPPTNAEMDARTILAANYFDPATDTVSNVTTVATLTGHTPQTADHTASIAAILADTAAVDTTAELQTLLMGSAVAPASTTQISTAQSDLDILTGTDGVTLATSQPNYAPSKAGDSMDLTSLAVDNIWDEPLSAATHNVSTSSGRRLRSIQDFGIYDLAAVWVDEVSGTSIGTTPGEDATVTNRANDFDNAQSIASSIGLSRIYISNGNSITLTNTINNFELGIPGGNWNLNLGNQDITGCDIHDADVTGTGLGTSLHFHGCTISSATIPQGEYFQCGLDGTAVTIGSTGNYKFIDCYNDIPESSSPVLDMGSAIGATNVFFRRWSGGLTINNIQTGDIIALDVISGGTITLNGTGGIVYIRGICNIVDNSTGAISITDTSVLNQTVLAGDQSTVLDRLAGIMDKTHTLTTPIGSFDPATDSLEAIKDNGDINWSGSIAGLGSTPVDHNFGGVNALSYEIDNLGVEGVGVSAYVKSEYDSNPYTATRRAYVLTSADGSWEQPMMLNSGTTYVLVFYKPGVAGPDTVTITP